MAGTIIADFIRADANKFSINVGNTIIASVNSLGILSNTGNVMVSSSGAITANNISTGRIVTPSVMPTGSVLQVVQTVKTDTFSSSSQSTFVDITGMSVSITPSSTSSRIMVSYNLCTSIVNGGYGCIVRLLRDSTNIAQGTPSGSVIGGTTQSYSASSAAEYPVYIQNMNFLDSPATTSTITYKLQARGWNTSAGTFYINQSAAEGNTINFSRTISTITVMEIAG